MCVCVCVRVYVKVKIYGCIFHLLNTEKEEAAEREDEDKEEEGGGEELIKLLIDLVAAGANLAVLPARDKTEVALRRWAIIIS